MIFGTRWLFGSGVWGFYQLSANAGASGVRSRISLRLNSILSQRFRRQKIRLGSSSADPLQDAGRILRLRLPRKSLLRVDHPLTAEYIQLIPILSKLRQD